MECITTVALLRLALKCLDGVASKQSPRIPALAMIKLEGGRLEATNIDITISVPLPTERCKGSALIPYRPISRLMAACDPSSRVVMRQKDTSSGIVIEVDGGIYHMPTLAVDEFPVRRDGDWEGHSFDGERYRDAIGFCLPFTSKEETRYYLNGVHLDGDTVVATDGHRLGLHTVAGASMPKIIVPTAVAKLLVKFPGVNSIDISSDGRMTRFDAAGVRVQANLIDGTYPDYRRVIPDTAGLDEWTIPRRPLKSAVSRLAAVNQRYYGSISLLLKGGACALGMMGVEEGYRAGAIVQEVASDGGREYETGINVNYFSQAINSIPDDDIRLLVKAGDSASPFILRGEADDRFVVQMPMRAVDSSMAKSMLAERRSEAA